MATIYDHLEKESRNDVAVQLKDSFYVDNVVARVQNEIELQRFQTIAFEIVLKAGFEFTRLGFFLRATKSGKNKMLYTWSFMGTKY
ncbi:hypothetical protein TNIN_193521 [Trichonephila inaurata madagascariensis]|uniref:Uncharacterized protein n=1 Tax=Trichonephila inaurata madagascariensis TaxID=2747483 RepID=A0A8X6Y3A6_9ARAC|nr:hypothetical protein TNIN_193521 [Trichonephila inaurata madagascariensis]